MPRIQNFTSWSCTRDETLVCTLVEDAALSNAGFDIRHSGLRTCNDVLHSEETHGCTLVEDRASCNVGSDTRFLDADAYIDEVYTR